MKRRSLAALLPLLALAACGGGDDPTPSDHTMGVLTQDKINELIAQMARRPVRQSQWVATDTNYVWSGKPIGSGFSMRGYCPPIEDQLTFNECTSNAVVGACEMYLNSAGRYISGRDDLSRMYNYWWSGVLDNLQGLDVGRSARNAVAAAAQYGICKETTEPYDAKYITQAPSDAAVAEAALHTVSKFSRVIVDKDNTWNTVANVKQAINDGVPVTMAFICHRWVFDISGPLSTHYLQPGAINPGDPRGDIVGNHEVVIVGFQDTNDGTGGYFLVRNSWGTSWGDNGYWAMPYLFIFNAFELWAVEGFDGIGNNPTPIPLSPTDIATARTSLASLGLGTLNSDGSLSFPPTMSNSDYAAVAAILKRMGQDSSGMAQTTGIDKATIDTWLATNQSLVNAWLAILK